MNRRNFIRGLLTSAAGFAILPGAGRLWVPEKKIVPAYKWMGDYDTGFALVDEELIKAFQASINLKFEDLASELDSEMKQIMENS